MKTILNSIQSREDFFKGVNVLESKCAWLTFGAIMALEYVLTEDMAVLELGSGGSTLFFADRCRIVISIETDEKWEKRMQKKITEGYNNVAVYYHTENTAIEMVNVMSDELYDVVLIDTGWIDGEVRKSPDRLKLALAVAPKVKKGGYLILDNYQKYGLSKFPTAGWEVYTFDDFRYSGKGTRILKKL